MKEVEGIVPSLSIIRMAKWNGKLHKVVYMSDIDSARLKTFNKKEMSRTNITPCLLLHKWLVGALLLYIHASSSPFFI